MKDRLMASIVPFTKDSQKLNPIDRRIGKRIRFKRRALGYSQEKLASSLGITFQQVQKYEKGVNKVGIARLFDIAKILQVPINFFFDDSVRSVYTDETIEASETNTTLVAHDVIVTSNDSVDTIHHDETAQLLKAYYDISDHIVRQKVLNVIRVMSE